MIHLTGAAAVLPETTSSSLPSDVSTMLVAQALVLNRPFFHIKVSSSPSAVAWPMRVLSASSSASPQRLTDRFTVCQLHPSSSAMSLMGRPLPIWRVAQRPARVVSRSLGGAIRASCSTTVPAGHSPFLQRRLRLCHTSRTDRPDEGKSTSSTSLSPSDHNTPPQLPHGGLCVVQRTPTRSSPPGCSSAERTSTSPSPTNTSMIRVASDSTGILQFSVVLHYRFWGIPPRFTHEPSNTKPT